MLSAFGFGCANSKYKDYGYERPFEFENKKMANHNYLAKRGSKDYFRNTYDDAIKANNTNGAVQERNAILSELMYMVDGAHGEFERNTRFWKDAADFFADIAVLGVNGAGTVTGGAETKAIMNAIAGGITGSKLAVNKDLFQEQAIEAIESQMNASMKDRKAQIIISMRNDVSTYPLELGLSDVVNYYYDGTYARALQNILQTAKDKENTADAAVMDAINPTNKPAKPPGN